MEEVVDELVKSIREYDPERAKKLAEKVVELGIDPVLALDAASQALREMGDMFAGKEISSLS